MSSDEKKKESEGEESDKSLPSQSDSEPLSTLTEVSEPLPEFGRRKRGKCISGKREEEEKREEEGPKKRKKKRKIKNLATPAEEALEKEKKEKKKREEVSYDLSSYNVEQVVRTQAYVRRFLATIRIKKIKKMAKKRRDVAEEMLKVGKGFLLDMQTVKDSYLTPISAMKSSKNEVFRELAGHFALLSADVQVILGYEKHIETRLESRFDAPKLKIADIFKQMVAFLKTYTQYVTNYTKTQAILVAHKNDEELLNLFASLAPEGERRGVRDFLIMPVQRIPRLKLMLEELLKNTWPAHPDHEDLGQAAKKIAEVATYVELAQQKASARARVIEISSLLQFPNGKKLFQVVSPSRLYITEGTIQSQLPGGSAVLLSNEVFLFNDLLLFASKRTDPKGETFFLYKASLFLLDIVSVKRGTTMSGRPSIQIFGQSERDVWRLLYTEESVADFWAKNIEDNRTKVPGEEAEGSTNRKDLRKAYSISNLATPSSQTSGGLSSSKKNQKKDKKKFFTLKRNKTDGDKKKEVDEQGKPRFGTLSRLKNMRGQSEKNLLHYGTLPKQRKEDTPDEPTDKPATARPSTGGSGGDGDGDGGGGGGGGGGKSKGNAARGEARLSSIFSEDVYKKNNKEKGGDDGLSTTDSQDNNGSSTGSNLASSDGGGESLKTDKDSVTTTLNPLKSSKSNDKEASLSLSQSGGGGAAGGRSASPRARSWKTRTRVGQPQDANEFSSAVEEKYKQIEEEQERSSPKPSSPRSSPTPNTPSRLSSTSSSPRSSSPPSPRLYKSNSSASSLTASSASASASDSASAQTRDRTACSVGGGPPPERTWEEENVSSRKRPVSVRYLSNEHKNKDFLCE